MSEAETLDMVAKMAIDNGAGDETPAAATCCTSAAAKGVDMELDVSTADKENNEVRQRACGPQDPGLEPTLIACVPTRGGQADDNHLNSDVNRAASEEPDSQVGHLTEDSVRQRAEELFADGSGVPAVPPQQPPIMEKANNRLCMLVCLLRCYPLSAAPRL